ncbi:CHAD domain-containing protein [Phenylobacterium sp.]|uniref:CYTH and CHAD domain-containing protein n=1 Tax=Phenylobacterium sp. TaxID=1871053 RepID=UPI00286C7D62|nr:CHAD domain-containing protein [Phenylobacterium sp.]
MPVDREVELKFTCRAADMAAVLAAAPPGRDETRELIGVYFDTPDRDLQKAGATLRVRDSNGLRTQTLKLGAGLIRAEHEAPIEGLAPDPRRGPLAKLLPRGACLRPVFNVQVTRRQRTVCFHNARIELALDVGKVTCGERTSPIGEVELELKDGPASALFDLARELSAAAPLDLAFDSKAARGQALMAGEGPALRPSGQIELAAAVTVGGAFQAVARQALAQMADAAATLRDAPQAEAVHRLRVGARRFRGALKTFRPALAGSQEVEAGLRWLGRSCDLARNLDAFAEETLQPAPGGRRRRGRAQLRATLEAARRCAREGVTATVSSARFRALMIGALAWIETGDWRGGAVARAPLPAYADKALKQHLKTVLKRGRAARDARGLAGDAARHRLRIAAKTLRYAAEALSGLYRKKPAERFLRRVRGLQDVLGQLNDLATAEPLMAGLALSPDAAFAAGELLATRAAEAPRLIAEATHRLRKLGRAERFWDR